MKIAAGVVPGFRDNTISSFRKHLNAAALLASVRKDFEQIHDPRVKPEISLGDTIMSALAMFGLKCQTLLQFEERKEDEVVKHNLDSLYGVTRAPSDTRMREILDPLDPHDLTISFRSIIAQLQRGKALEPYKFMDDYLLLSGDGTQYYTSHKVSCDTCCVKNHTNGTTSYYHQSMNAVITHPDQKVVIPIGIEPIQNSDGTRKNDCERNASKRLWSAIAADFPRLKFVVVEDGLSPNAPHILHLKQLGMRFVLVCKPNDHEYLYAYISDAENIGDMGYYDYVDPTTGWEHKFRFVNDVPLNSEHEELLVNWLEYRVFKKDGTQEYFNTWVTDFRLDKSNLMEIAQGGRARFTIENETFNTLKNHGYNYEHNYGHGETNLSAVFATLMFLAFAIDQVQRLVCPAFAQARAAYRSNKSMWEDQRGFFRLFRISNWKQLYELLAYHTRISIDPSSVWITGPPSSFSCNL